MNALTWVILIALLIVDKVLEKRYFNVWRVIQLPINIFYSIVSLLMSWILIGGTQEVVSSSIDMASKVLFALFVLIGIAVFVWGNISIWKKWWETYKTK